MKRAITGFITFLIVYGCLGIIFHADTFEKVVIPDNLILAQASKGANEAEIKLPNFLGIYIVSKGKLIELKKSSKTALYEKSGVAVEGSEMLDRLSGINLSDGNVEFIIYHQSVAQLTELYVKKIARIRNREIYQPFKKLPSIQTLTDNRYVVMKEGEGYRLRLAPINKNPYMMIRAVLERKFEPGIYALLYRDDLYDFTIEGGAVEYVDQVINGSQAVSYRNCFDKVFESEEFKPANSIEEKQKKTKIYLIVKSDMNTTYLRDDPDYLISTKIICEVKNGTRVEMLEKIKSYTKVKLTTGEVGWITNKDLIRVK